MNSPDDNDATIIRPIGPSAAAADLDAPTMISSPPVAPPAVAAADAAGHEGGNALPVGSRQAEFEVVRVLGEGGFGIVYLARDHALERMVALKEYMPAALALRGERSQVRVRSDRHRDTFEAGLKSFINEARLLAQFDHPSLVKVYRFWEANGTAFMVMPFIEGKTVKDTLKEMGAPPDEAWLMNMLAPLTEALLVLHGENCYHRDIAPDNIILVRGSNAPLLLDFGAARRVIGDMTQALTVILKPGYAPIEQYAEVPSLKQGPWTDVYALAAVIYCAITGRTPPPSVGRIVKDDYVPLAQLAQGRYSDRLAAAVDQALQVMPDNRIASMEQFREALGLSGHYTPRPGQMATQIQAPAAPAAGPSAADAPAPAPEKGRLPLFAGLGLAGVAAAGAAAYFLTRAPAPVETAAVDTPPVVAATPAPSPAPATVGPVAAPVPDDLHGQFMRLASQHTPGFDVQAQAERALLRIDKDDLRFSVTTSREGHLYVLLAGPDGSLIQLFPNDKARNNRMAAGQTLKLPQASWPLKAAEPAGLEHFLVLVTAEPRTFAPWATEKDPSYGFLSLPSKGPAVAPGAPSWLLGQPDCGRPSCATEFGAAVFSVEAVK
ncbi:serine/threonine protein kinase [Roseateles sp. DC23W]|uniref:Serine/threonine protein kinase n=1 Tax=Pelomonas dachongensis TaxID=3299029 RepID=A0ABW7EI03_9BURK